MNDKAKRTADPELVEKQTSDSQNPSAGANQGNPTPASDHGGETVACGVVVDTHHPDRPGRIFVRWLDRNAKTKQAWLETNASLRFDVGTQVMLLRGPTWHEWIVAFPFGEAAFERNTKPLPRHEEDAILRLEPAQGVQVQGAHGQPLFRVGQDVNGQAILEMPGDLNMDAQGVFRVSAERIELRSGQGGTDTRSDGEMVVRGTKIHLN